MNKNKAVKWYVYENRLHNTECRSRYSPEQLDQILYDHLAGKATPTQRQFARRMHRRLCGIGGCMCGDMFGRRDY